MAHATLLRMPAAVGLSALRSHSRCSTVPALLIRLGLLCTETSGLSKSHRRKGDGCPRLTTALSGICDTLSLENDETDIGRPESYELHESGLGPPPDTRYQPQLLMKDRKALRSKAETMAKEKRLINIQIGHLGMTRTFLRACADILQKHSLVRVKLGEGCGLERRAASELLEKYLDCVCVHQIGFTVTLYRQAGLPRPSNTVREAEEGCAANLAAAALKAEALTRSAAAEEKQSRKKAGQQKPQQRPPEFSVL